MMKSWWKNVNAPMELVLGDVEEVLDEVRDDLAGQEKHHVDANHQTLLV